MRKQKINTILFALWLYCVKFGSYITSNIQHPTNKPQQVHSTQQTTYFGYSMESHHVLFKIPTFKRFYVCFIIVRHGNNVDQFFAVVSCTSTKFIIHFKSIFKVIILPKNKYLSENLKLPMLTIRNIFTTTIE